jgi:hypothetical protein
MAPPDVKAAILVGWDPVVFPMAVNACASDERDALRDWAEYRRTLYEHSSVLDSGRGHRERVFSNVYDVLFAHRGVHGDYDQDRLYRGHLDSRWKLQASYYRSAPRPQEPEPEEERAHIIASFYEIHTVPLDEMSTTETETAIRRLRGRYPDVDLRGLTPLQQNAIVQHYVSGTKLLDFTRSIYIAAFFATAVGRDCAEVDTGAIYRVAPKELDPMAKVEAPELPERFVRIHRQRGVFLYIRYRGALTDWLRPTRWVFRQTEAARPFEVPQCGVTSDHLLAAEISEQEAQSAWRRPDWREWKPKLTARLPRRGNGRR